MGSEKSQFQPAARRTRGIVLSVIAFVLVVASLVRLRSPTTYTQGAARGKSKLVWFIPDGLRADPDVFQIFRWAREGKLPNLRRMMEEGAWGYSIPVFPSHTPVNYASLFTGTNPLKHGVADGPMRLVGYPLSMISLSGFHSTAKTIDPVWTILENAGLVSTLLTVPGSTPPETESGAVIKGRWGGWGIDFPPIVFDSWKDEWLRDGIGWNDRVFGVEKKLTEFTRAGEPAGWAFPLPPSHSPPREVNLRNWGADLYLLLTDSTDDGAENYDTATVSLDKKAALFTLKPGEWSGWFPLDLRYETAAQYQKDVPGRLRIEEELSGVHFRVPTRLKIIRLGARDQFRVRVLYDGLNPSLTRPSSLAAGLEKAAGPMVDFVDNYPPQLVYFPEDKATFLEESAMSFDWHRKAAAHLLREQPEDVFIHSIYSPNQMLTSRWWMGAVDPRSSKYAKTPQADRDAAWRDVLAMYRRVDDMLGDALASLGPDSYLVFSSDHGVAALNQEVRLNNLFARKGWLAHRYDAKTRRHEIDWDKTKVVYLNMNHVYLNPAGLAGPYHPASGPEYEKLRAAVVKELRELRNEAGEHPLADLVPRSEAASWGLPGDRVGDLVIANAPGFSWAEDVSADGKVFTETFKGGYKQAILTEKEKALWTPFVILGPGVKKGYEIPHPIHHVDQLPTILHLLHVPMPYEPDGRSLDEIYQH
jgi:predicted AlkP superfamily phosphohydrolase/phosphomutase